MRKILTGAVVAALAAMVPVAQAATAEGTFNVNITLTSKCEINSHPNPTGATITDLALAYTSFQTTASTGTTTFSVRCTDGLSATDIAVDSASVTDGTTGLAYTLAVSTSNVHSVGPTASTGAVTPGAGGTTYYVHGNIAANQGGTVTAGVANNTRTITVTY